MQTLTRLWLCAVATSSLAAQEIAPPPNQLSVPGAPGPVPAPPPPADWTTPAPNAWFEQTQCDLGLFYDEEEAVGRFKFRNPREQPHQLSNLQPNCACSKAIVRVGDRTYEIGADKLLYRAITKDGTEVKERVAHVNVGAGEGGEVEVHMTMTGIRGPKEAGLMVQSSDQELPLINLRWRATGAQYFVVEPPDVNLNEMAWGDKRDFEFRITSPLKSDFNLLSHEPLAKGMQVQFDKEMQDGKAVWRVRGSYGPEVDERDQGGTITFKTDIDGKSVAARILAYIKGPLTMKPGGFVSLGHVPTSEGREVEVVLTPNGEFDLQVEQLEVARLSGLKEDQRELVHFTHRREGKDIKVVIRVDQGMTPTYLNGLLKIHLNHPACRLKEVMFNGFVR